VVDNEKVAYIPRWRGEAQVVAAGNNLGPWVQAAPAWPGEGIDWGSTMQTIVVENEQGWLMWLVSMSHM